MKNINVKSVIDFRSFSHIISKTNNLNNALILSFISFQMRRNADKKYLRLNKSVLVSIFDLSKRQLETRLSELECLGLIEKKIKVRYGKKYTFVKTNEKKVPIHFTKLFALKDFFKSIRRAIIFCFVSFRQNITNIKFNREKYSFVKLDQFSKLICYSIRTIQKDIEYLKKLGHIHIKRTLFSNRNLLFFNIPKFVFKTINNIFFANCKNFVFENAEFARSYNKEEYVSVKTNNTKDPCEKRYPHPPDKGLDVISFSLTKKQINYLKSAISRTKSKFDLNISSPDELLAQIQYSITNPQQMKGITSFRHAVNRVMKLLSVKKWMKPHGFEAYDSNGIEIRQRRISVERAWQDSKNIRDDMVQS